MNELQESLDLSLKAKQAAEDLSKGQEERIVDLQDKIEDQTHDLGVAKKKLQEEINHLSERHKADLDEIRKKIPKRD